MKLRFWRKEKTMALQLQALKDAIAAIEVVAKDSVATKAALDQANADLADAQAQVDALTAQLKA